MLTRCDADAAADDDDDDDDDDADMMGSWKRSCAGPMVQTSSPIDPQLCLEAVFRDLQYQVFSFQCCSKPTLTICYWSF